MTSIDAALQELTLDPSKKISTVAESHGVNRSTLSRRWRGVTKNKAEAYQDQRLLTLPQEKKLIQHINRLTDRGLPPTVSMVCNMAYEIGGREPGKSWSSRFTERNKSTLSSGYLQSIDRQRLKADSKASYRQYFDLLHSKIERYAIEPKNTYNMDEKGFLIGFGIKMRRIYSKAAIDKGALAGAYQDGNREWITILATVCADGTSLPPVLIFAGQPGQLQDSWVQDVDTAKDYVSFGASPNGWTSNEIAIDWMKRVFDKHTKQKARNGRDWRLLIMDGHGSHVTVELLDWCHNNHIIVAVYPPHSTHRLQPLDVGLFAPLAVRYGQQLDQHIVDSQGISAVTKRDFYRLFRPAYALAFTQKNILSSFEKCGISPFKPEHVLDHMTSVHSSRPATAGTTTSSDNVPAAVKARKEVRFVQSAIDKYTLGDHTAVKLTKFVDKNTILKADNSVLKHENDTMRRALYVAQQKRPRNKTLTEQMRSDTGSGTLIFSPHLIKHMKDTLAQKEANKANDAAAKQAAKDAKKALQLAKELAKLERKQQRAIDAERKKVEKADEDRRKQLQNESDQATKQL
jgi:hypothetical protein